MGVIMIGNRHTAPEKKQFCTMQQTFLWGDQLGLLLENSQVNKSIIYTAYWTLYGLTKSKSKFLCVKKVDGYKVTRQKVKKIMTLFLPYLSLSVHKQTHQQQNH